MILDTQMELATNQDLGSISGNVISENVIDRGNANSDMTTGQKGTWYFRVAGEVFNTLTGLTVSIESSAAAALTSARVHVSRYILLADLDAEDTLIRIGRMGGPMSLRYVGGRFTVTGTDCTTGMCDLFFVADGQENPAV